MEMNSELLKNLSHHIQKLNLYSLPKYFWLVLLYYLSLNTVLNLFLNVALKEPFLSEVVPDEAIRINNLILTVLEKWIPFIWFLCIALVICGFSIAFLKIVTTNVKDLEYGLHLGYWLFIIVITFDLYNFLGSFFLLLIPFTALVKYGLDRLMEKYDITFG